jgi:multiple antibiotic resistance protein
VGFGCRGQAPPVAEEDTACATALGARFNAPAVSISVFLAKTLIEFPCLYGELSYNIAMLTYLQPYILAFIPIFVAVDAIGNIPLFIALVEGASPKQRHKIVADSVSTATLVAVLFMFAGKWVFGLLSITIPDFQIAGGALLFVIAVRLLLPGSQKGLLVGGHDKEAGVFPLGTPLITGPATLTTTLIVLDSYGPVPTFVSLAANMLIVWLTLAKADIFMKVFGAGGTRAFSKIMYILLAAIAVMMMRRGIIATFLR